MRQWCGERPSAVNAATQRSARMIVRRCSLLSASNEQAIRVAICVEIGYNVGTMGDPEPQENSQLPRQPEPQSGAEHVPERQPSVPFPLQQGERVLRIIRRHWWFLWPYTLWLVIVAVAPVVAIALLFDAIGILGDLGWFFWVPALLWVLYWGIRALFNWYRYHNDIWVVTNQRLIDVFRSNPLNKRVSTADLVNIQDMRVERHGVTATVLGYSDLLCSTAGTEGGTFTINGVPQAEELQLLIDRERDRERMRRD